MRNKSKSTTACNNAPFLPPAYFNLTSIHPYTMRCTSASNELRGSTFVNSTNDWQRHQWHGFCFLFFAHSPQFRWRSAYIRLAMLCRTTYSIFPTSITVIVSVQFSAITKCENKIKPNDTMPFASDLFFFSTCIDWLISWQFGKFRL